MKDKRRKKNEEQIKNERKVKKNGGAWASWAATTSPILL